MEVAKILHMNGGDGEASYASSSFLQRKGISLMKHIREEAITNLYCRTLPRSLAIVDMGCSSGPNTLSIVSEFIMVVEKLCQELKNKSPEYIVFFNDLPGNDFPNIFKSLNGFKEKLCDRMKVEVGPCYFFGAPGSFYGRLFPSRSLHYVHSSSSLNWLSKVPEGVNHNKSNIYIIKEDLVNTFNAPIYSPSPSEVKLEVLNEGSFAINHLEVSEVSWNAYDDSNSFDIESKRSRSLGDYGYSLAQCMRAVVEPLMRCHFDEAIIEETFSRYQKILADRMSKERPKFISVTIVLTRKA